MMEKKENPEAAPAEPAKPDTSKLIYLNSADQNVATGENKTAPQATDADKKVEDLSPE